MSTPLESVYRLRCSCNEYPWGRLGSQSISARLCEAQGGWQGDDGPKGKFQIEDSKPYAEMWMGTYPVLPSYIAETGEDLQDVLDRYPKELIGDETIKKFGHTKLPFLPKVLSISKALPLQVHPNKKLATKLHEENPNDFTDPNHKPEIALALSKFEAFCGFKPLDEINKIFQIPALQRFVPEGASATDMTNDSLKESVRLMLSVNDNVVKETYKALTSTPKSDFGPKGEYITDLAPRLASQYAKSDPGLLVALLTMNYLILQAGESIYIPADGIHAYLSGDIVECMARSNNVVNSGFCPRVDSDTIDLFCSTLSFSPHSAEESMLRPKPYKRSKNGKTVIYSPPMNEFDMLQTELKAGESDVLGAAGGPSILLSTKGDAELKAKGKTYDLKEGFVFFVAPGTEIEIQSEKGVIMQTSFVEGSTQ